jgi:hypothetical protein
MSTHTITGFITHQKYPWEDKAHIGFSMYEPSSEHVVIVREHSFDVEVADDFDARPQKVARLHAEKQKVRAEFAKRIAEIDDGIAKLLALECSEAAA